MNKNTYYHYKTALKAGYSPDEILDYLSDENPKIAEAREAGYKPDEILGYIEALPSRSRSIAGSLPKSAIKETGSQIRKSLQFLPEKLGLLAPEESGAISDEEAEEKLEKAFPTREGFAEGALERTGKNLPYALLGGTNLLGQSGRAAVGGLLGQGAEELGLPEWTQGLAEGAPFLVPNLLSSKIPTTDFNQYLLEGARKLGLKEKEIAPLVQGEKKSRFLSKVSPRRGRTQKLLNDTYEALGRVRNQLEGSPIANKAIAPHIADETINEMTKLLTKMPEGLKKDLLVDFAQLTSQPMTGESLINFYKKLNYYIPKGFEQLGMLKGPVYNALESISPELATDFRLTNDLFKKYYDISKKLSPTLVSDLFSAAGAVRTLTGIATGNYPMLIEMAGETGGRLLAREMLLNPRFQNLGKKMLTAVSARDFGAANKMGEQFKHLIAEYEPEVAKKIGKIDFRRAIQK